MATSEYAALLRRAEADLQALRHMPDAFAFDEAVFGFHAQQACEKALKAWLLYLACEAPFIHDLRQLIGLLADAGVVVDDAEAIARLTKYAVQWRYGDMPHARPLDRPATERLFRDEDVRRFRAIERQARRRLLLLHRATTLPDLTVPPGNRLEALAGDRHGQHSIRIHDQWRICFRWQDGDALDVEIVDYH